MLTNSYSYAYSMKYQTNIYVKRNALGNSLKIVGYYLLCPDQY